MNKIIIITLLILIAVFSLGKINSYANEDNNINRLDLNRPTKIDDNSNIFRTSEEGKNKKQFRIKTRHDNNSYFVIKGVITSSSQNSLTITDKNIKIDPLITGEIKIIGNIEIGSYVMIKGVEINSTLYAEKIIVNQRNKNNFDDDLDKDNSSTNSATPTPTIILDEDEDSTTTAKLDFANIINTIQGFLNYLVGIASKI